MVSLHLSGRALSRLGSRRGQFFLFRFLARGRWWESHPFSLSAAPTDSTFHITVKESGDFTRHVSGIPVGTRVVAEGPFGVSTESTRRRDRVLMIAGGIGITPLRSMLENMSGDLVLIYRVISESDVVFREELKQLAKDRQVTMIVVAGDHADPAAKHLLSPSHLQEMVPDLAGRDVYISGQPAMTQIAKEERARSRHHSQTRPYRNFAL